MQRSRRRIGRERMSRRRKGYDFQLMDKLAKLEIRMKRKLLKDICKGMNSMLIYIEDKIKEDEYF
jgi:hypothetical protein